MKKILMIILITCTLNGCGLFNKISKKKDKEVFKTHLDVVDKSINEVNILTTKSKTDSNIVIDKSNVRSTIKGSSIKVDNQGNIDCQDCEVNQEKKNDINSFGNKKENEYENKKETIKTDLKAKTSLEKAITKEVKESDPKSFSIISNYIGAAIFLVITIVGVFYFTSKIKKK